jgi:precorrin-2 dehydrogenase/sirohydrochlorin ferrochelatase
MFLKLAERRCLVVGAGGIATSKISALLESGARVTVVAPWALEEVRECAEAGSVEWIEREFLANDLDGVFLAIAATSRADVNHAVFSEAAKRNILCNAVDDPPNCDFYFGAVVRRGDLQIAISTAGESPALAQRLRREIDERLDPSLGDWLGTVGALRREILADSPASDARKSALHQLAHVQVCESAECPARRAAWRDARGAANGELTARGADEVRR